MSTAVESPQSSDLVPASQVFRSLGFSSEQAMNHSRVAIQKVFDPDTRSAKPYPDFRSLYPHDSVDQLKRRRVRYDASHILVVPEWGAIKWPNAKWLYSRARCDAFARDGFGALSTGPAMS